MKALSVRQPWAWLLVNGPSPGVPWKPVENREWQTDKNQFGPTLIHASSGMTRKEYDDCRSMVSEMLNKAVIWIDLARFPKFEELQRGGIVGEVEIIGYMRRARYAEGTSARRLTQEQLRTFSKSPWFFGTVGICIENVRPLPFRPLKGMLGFFNVPEL